MKKVMFITLLALISTNAIAQKNEEKEDQKVNAPTVVIKAFQKDYPKVTKVNWVTEGNDFEAEFKLNGKETSANYDKTGKRVETELEIKKEQLPANALCYIKKYFSTYKVLEAFKVTDAKNAVSYEVEISKIGKSLDLIFDAKGNFLKKD
ncbi:MAG: PepSY-like domain-containing protein [Bacteroidales bacterium]